ncbi:histone-lysine N-methyltransferase SETMAR [Trichonephila clavipes]|nr:histone-lysine N-methyltransferase SETMAR [Trichonephila clavipes]
MQRLKWAGHLIRLDDDRIPKKFFVVRPYGTRKRGIPRLRSINFLEKELKTIKIKHWKNLTKNRTAWSGILRKVKDQPPWVVASLRKEGRILQEIMRKCEIVNGVYGAETVTDTYVQFKFRRFRSGIFDVKLALRTGRPVVENVEKITEIIDVCWHVSSRNITRELKIDYKTVLNHLCEVVFKKKLDVWVPHHLTPIIIMDQISISKALAKRNKINSFLKRMVTGDEKLVTYDNIV